MLLRKVTGRSMLPGLAPGAIVAAWGREVRVGDVVIARQTGREVIKRVARVESGRYYLHGDNALESVDSREFGPVGKEDILGVVMIKLPEAVKPPKPKKSYAPMVGWVAAFFMTGAAFVHLFRIDTFVPLVDEALPGGLMFASLAATIIVISEVFAVPFLLRMKLSPLMHLKSGFLAVMAPLFWLLITIWGLGSESSTAQFGEFVDTPGSMWLLVANAAWLGFNLWTLWLLGYDRISILESKSKRR